MRPRLSRGCATFCSNSWLIRVALALFFCQYRPSRLAIRLKDRRARQRGRRIELIGLLQQPDLGQLLKPGHTTIGQQPVPLRDILRSAKLLRELPEQAKLHDRAERRRR